MEQRCCKTAAHRRGTSERTVRQWTLRLDNLLRFRGLNMYETTHRSQLGLTKETVRRRPSHEPVGRILHQFSQIVTRLQLFSEGSQLGLVPGNGCRQNLA